MQNMEPKFDPFALNRNDWPVMAWVNRIPGVSRAIASHLSRTALVRSSEVRVGQLDVGQQVTHVLGRDEPRPGSW